VIYGLDPESKVDRREGDRVFNHEGDRVVLHRSLINYYENRMLLGPGGHDYSKSLGNEDDSVPFVEGNKQRERQTMGSQCMVSPVNLRVVAVNR